MNLPIVRGELCEDGVSHAVKSVYYKVAESDIIGRTNGMSRGGVLVIYEL